MGKMNKKTFIEPGESEDESSLSEEGFSDGEGSESENESGESYESASESGESGEGEDMTFEELAKKQGNQAKKTQRNQTKRQPSKHVIEKRSNKNAPVEVSSKVPVPVFREVIAPARKKGRDPRFEKLCGHYNPDLFKKSYTFLKDVKKQEIEETRKALKKAKNPVVSQKLKDGLRRMEQREKAAEVEDKKASQRAAVKKLERERVAAGKKPYFMKRRDQKNLELVQKYADLKKEGKLNKYIEKRRKKTSAKDHRYMPYERRGDE